jgi:predicted PurR-regulated permease PerM
MNNKKIFNICLMLMIFYLSLKLLAQMSAILNLIFKICLPIILAFAISFILNPLKRRINKKIKNNLWSTCITVIIFLGMIVLFFVIIFPNIIKELVLFFEKMPEYFSLVETIYNKIFVNYFKKINIDIGQALKSFFYTTFESIIQKIIGFLQTIISYSITLFISFFISIYILYDYESIINWIKNNTNNNKFHKIRTIMMELNDSLYTFFKGLIKINGLMFLFSTLLFLIIGLDFAVAVALVLAITNIIPYIGPYIGGSFAVIIALNTSINKAFYVFLIIICLQFIDNYIISPRIQGSNANIKPVILLISVFIMGSLFGVFGMIIAVPTVYFFQIIYNNLIKKGS